MCASQKKTNKSLAVVYVIKKVRLQQTRSKLNCFVGLVEGGTNRINVMLCCRVIDAYPTSNDE